MTPSPTLSRPTEFQNTQGPPLGRSLRVLVHLYIYKLPAREQARIPTRTSGQRRVCAVRAFCRKQNLGGGRIHFARAFEISQDSIKITTPLGVVIFMEVPPRFELGSGAFAELCLTTWLWHRTEQKRSRKIGASDEARTRYLHLGKVALYQMSYTRRLPGS